MVPLGLIEFFWIIGDFDWAWSVFPELFEKLTMFFNNSKVNAATSDSKLTVFLNLIF